jgi:hypothetical protein
MNESYWCKLLRQRLLVKEQWYLCIFIYCGWWYYFAPSCRPSEAAKCRLRQITSTVSREVSRSVRKKTQMEALIQEPRQQGSKRRMTVQQQQPCLWCQAHHHSTSQGGKGSDSPRMIALPASISEFSARNFTQRPNSAATVTTGRKVESEILL